MLILLVENDRNELENLKQQVATVYTQDKIEAFTDSRKALEYAKETDINICFAEVVMKPVSGIAIAKELKSKDSRIIVNLISDTEYYAMDAWKLYVNDYLVKPITKESILHSRGKM